VDVGFWGGVVPANADGLELQRLYQHGVFGFKCFLVPSGVDEFPNVTEAELHDAMPRLAELGAVLLVHAELPGPIDEASRRQAGSDVPDPRRYRTFLESRPRAAEDEAIALMLRLCRQHRCGVHIVHLSSSDAVPMLRQAKDAGLPVTAETCLHYLRLAAEQVPDGATQYKCCPPIREADNRERLWNALAEGVVDMVVSDHSPCTPHLKCMDSGDFGRAWGGISSVQLGLPVLWTEARRRGHELQLLAEWLCAAPARFAGLYGRKGAIAAGFDADLVVWDPDETVRIEPAMIRHRHKLTPYQGQALHGAVHETWLRGRRIYDHDRLTTDRPAGQCLRREAAERSAK
jgi:allantoinase